MARRANQAGSISWDKKRKKFRARVSINTSEGPHRKDLGYFKSRASAQEAITEALSRYGRRLVTLDAETTTLAEYLKDWLHNTARHNVGGDTWRFYSHEVERHISPRIGDVVLSKLKAAHVRLVKQEMLEANLSEATVEHTLGTLSSALNQAVTDELIASNPARGVKRPKKRGDVMQILSEDQIAALLSHVAGTRHEALYQVAAKLGPRQGELAALMWEDIDFDRHTLTIRRSVQTRRAGAQWSATKSGAERVIILPPSIEASLRRHRAMQNEARLSAPSWENPALVFPNTRGGVYRRYSIYEDFVKILANAELPHIRFHDLRHVSATMMLQHGIPVHIVADILGHADPAITLRRYSHVLPSMQEQAARAIEDYGF